ncbi:GNAT family N-acetyltransferase [Pseudalkalibacillus sp. A8]|uniref:GNAT family N-acetyltransferase n=1 Tax=Pseudalkalibacillus sp. A8 TaxID=3382641 RepID=UPI0038B45354
MIANLYTKRLQLKKITTKDSAKLFKIWSDPNVTKFMNIDNFTNENQTRDMIDFLNKLAQDKKAIRFSIFKLESDELIGSCGYNLLDFKNAKAEIGYEIAKDFWGKGYAPESISSLITYGFDSLNLHRIEAKVEPENMNSIKVLQKLNFTFEGKLRQCEKSKGKFIDLNIYSKLRTD